jgi:predicted RND superfamily exporter protein
VIGGLITSTLLSLLVVPAVFTYVDDIEHWLGRMGRKLKKHPHHPVRSEERTVK